MGQSNRSMPQALNPGELGMRIKIPIGAAGATGTIEGVGVVSVTKNAAGVYDIVLDRGFVQLLKFDGSIQAAAGALNHPVIKTAYVAGSTALQFQTCVQAGTATEPASGDVIMLDLIFDQLGLV